MNDKPKTATDIAPSVPPPQREFFGSAHFIWRAGWNVSNNLFGPSGVNGLVPPRVVLPKNLKRRTLWAFLRFQTAQTGTVLSNIRFKLNGETILSLPMEFADLPASATSVNRIFTVSHDVTTAVYDSSGATIGVADGFTFQTYNWGAASSVQKVWSCVPHYFNLACDEVTWETDFVSAGADSVLAWGYAVRSEELP